MPDNFNPGLPTFNPANNLQRPLAVANQPAATVQPVANAPRPQDQYQAAPNAPAPRDPQQEAIFGVYALSLNDQNPVAVSQAIGVLENLGPAFREQAAAAVRAQLVPGQNPMRSQVLVDALTRWGDKQSTGAIQNLLRDPDPAVRESAAKAFAVLAGVPGVATSPMANGPTNAAAPAGAAPQAPQGPVTQVDQATQALALSYVERMRRAIDVSTVAVEIATQPTKVQAAILKALAADPSFTDDGAFDMLTKMLAPKAREPEALDALRAVLNRPGTYTTKMAIAKSRAGIATLYFGTPADQAGYLRLLAEKDRFLQDSMRGKMIEILMKSRPDVLQTRAAIVTLGALANDRYTAQASKAFEALASLKTPFARDVIGESQFWRNRHDTEYIIAALRQLKSIPGPYTPLTLENIRWVSQNMSTEAKAAAKAFLEGK